MIEITKFKPSDRASAEVFNKRLEEIETYIKNVVEENKALKLQLDNKADKTNIIYIEKNRVENIEISNKIQSIIDLGYEQGQFTCINCPDMPFQNWGACLRYSHNESVIYLATLHQSSTQNVHFRYYNKETKKWTTNWIKYTTTA